MSNYKEFKDSAYCRFLDFILPDEESMTPQEIQEELCARGINLEPAKNRIKSALAQAKEKKEAQLKLSMAAGKRAKFFEMIANIPHLATSLNADLQAFLKTISSEKQSVLYHRLQEAKSEEDFNSIIEDLKILDILNDDSNDNKS